MAQTWQEWLDVNTAEAVVKGIAEGLAAAGPKVLAEARAKARSEVRAENEARQRRLVVRLLSNGISTSHCSTSH